MFKKYGNPCATYNIPLNNDDNNVFRTGCIHLYNFLHCKSAEYKPLMLKMHLEFVDSPLMTEAEGKNIAQLEEKIKALTEALQQATNDENQLMDRIGKLEKNNSLDYERINALLNSSDNAARQSVQQFESKIKTFEDALLVQDRLKDDVNKLMDCVVKLENTLSINVVDKATDIVKNTSQDKSNKQAYDENNLNSDDSSLTKETEQQIIEHSNSNNGVLQSVQQLEARIKALEDALLQTKSDGIKLTECVETIEKNKAIDKSPDGGNNITHDRNAGKESHNENNLSGEQHNDTENVGSASEEHHTYTISEETQKVLDLRRNCVYIQNPKRNILSLDEAFSYVLELANEMNAQIADNSVIHIDMRFYELYVYFCDADSKREFLKNRLIYEYNPNTGEYLRILDYSDYGIVEISNFQSSDLSLETAFVNVRGLAKNIGMKNISSYIDHIDVYSKLSNFLTYYVRFNSRNVQNRFLRYKHVLKQCPETNSLKIYNVGGHTSSFRNVNNSSMALASANVIGVAELMGLSLSTDNVKRICVLNARNSPFADQSNVNFSLVVEFSSNDIKNKFLKKKSELNKININWSSVIEICDTETDKNIVSITYYTDSHVFAVISFIGLAKQLGFSFTPEEIDRFIELSEFIEKLYT